ncbi:MAG: DMT(Drug/metabolite transporter) superfamily permease [Actinomycetota bacterium]|jgi:drug/metabolite transporter (DMT)-like permease
MTPRGWFLLIALGLIWGIPYLLIKVAVEYFSPPTLVFLRVALAAAVLLPVVLAKGQWRQLRGHWRWVLVFALVEMAFTWMALNWAEQSITSSLAALIIALVPAVTAIIARIVGVDDRWNAGRIIGLIVGFIGVGVLVGFDLHAGNALAIAAMLVVVIGYSMGPLIVDLKLSDLPSLAVIAGAMVINTVIFAPFAVLNWPEVNPPVSAWAAVVILGLVCSALAFITFFALIAEVGPSRTTLITYINPVVAVVLGVLVLAEPLTFGLLIGLPLILVGSYLATRKAPALESEPHA